MSAELTVSSEFMNLIPPLSPDEYQQLEENIMKNGCLDPLIVWNGVIVDGHNRYSICKKHNLPYEVREISFSCNAEALSWICANQLGRRNISEEMRKYLIGKRFEAEKKITAQRNKNGFNQYKTSSKQESGKARQQFTSDRLGNEYHISHSTVEKYGIYSKAIDAIARMDTQMAGNILSGQYKMSHENILNLSKQDKAQIKKVENNLSANEGSFVTYGASRRRLIKEPEDTLLSNLQMRIKTMPEFDPEAEITGLVLTVPSWISSIDRVKKNTDVRLISANAKAKLVDAVLDLQIALEDLLKEVDV